MRCLITGGAGFLGSHLTETLLVHGHEVVVVDDLFRGKKKNLDDCKGSPGFFFVKGDACKLDDLEKGVETLGDVDLIFHLAAINGTRWFHERADSVVDVNINATIATLKLAERHAARLVFVSSPEAFGEVDEQPMGIGGDSLFNNPSLHQRHSYGASKYLGEILVQHAVRSKDIDCRVVRPFNAYGPRCPGNDYGQVVSIFLERTKVSRPLTVHGDGSQTRSFSWVGDIVEGIMLAGTTDNSLTDGESLAGYSWNMGWPEETTIAVLAQMVREVTGIDTGMVMTKGYPGDSARRIPDISDAEAELGWRPMTDLPDGLKRSWNYLNRVNVKNK
jgi:nucleoside-diphosphate-sugar epimerase